ncbi:MAG: hypothetical protein HZC40_11560 [Chloroflexi bacterium]|nr:hypothetical protein [Chloroflexota bacterium]
MTTLVHALPITALVLVLIYKWFALDDRYAVFLYNHLNATPFDAVTTSRYWMAGLVASAIVMLGYIAANFLIARFKRDYCAPTWWHVWLTCAVPLALAIPLIVMNVNTPTMPIEIALMLVAATLIGLVIALMPGSLAAHHPRQLAWIGLDGWGLIPVLSLLRAIELPGRGLSVRADVAYAFAIGSVVFGIVWLVALNGFRARRHIPSPRAWQVYGAGLGWCYIFLPLVHYLIATPAQFKYITSASNFFAFDPFLQLATFIVAGVLVFANEKFWSWRLRKSIA